MRILALLTEAETVRTCLDAATAAAGRLHEASVAVADVTTEFPCREMALAEEVDARPEGSRSGPGVRQAFYAWLDTHPRARGRVRWTETLAGDANTLSEQAARHDTLILAFPRQLSASDEMHTAFLRIQRPFILVPEQWAAKSDRAFAQHVVLRWAGSGACQRALFGALPWLRAASRVTVLLVDESESGLAAIETVLRQNLIQHDLAYSARPERLPGDLAVELAQQVAADLVVMGAYRSDIKAWLPAGATQAVLGRAHLPLLVAH